MTSTDDLSATYPAEADALPETGHQRSLTAEPVAALEPSVLLGTDVAGPPEVIGGLRRLGIPLIDSAGGVDGALALPGVSGTPAGRARRVLAHDDQLLLGGGPRSGEMLMTTVTDLHDGEGR